MQKEPAVACLLAVAPPHGVSARACTPATRVRRGVHTPWLFCIFRTSAITVCLSSWFSLRRPSTSPTSRSSSFWLSLVRLEICSSSSETQYPSSSLSSAAGLAEELVDRVGAAPFACSWAASQSSADDEAMLVLGRGGSDAQHCHSAFDSAMFRRCERAPKLAPGL